MENVFLITLEPIVDLSSILSLQATCKDALASGAPTVRVDAANVERLKTPVYQLLLSLQKTLQSQQRVFELASPSAGFLALARCLGLDVPLQLHLYNAGVA